MPSTTATKLARLAKEARACTRCPLYRNATQTVFGEGPGTAKIMLVGEQPGDQEDLQRHPFVDPAQAGPAVAPQGVSGADQGHQGGGKGGGLISRRPPGSRRRARG